MLPRVTKFGGAERRACVAPCVIHVSGRLRVEGCAVLALLRGGRWRTATRYLPRSRRRAGHYACSRTSQHCAHMYRTLCELREGGPAATRQPVTEAARAELARQVRAPARARGRGAAEVARDILRRRGGAGAAGVRLRRALHPEAEGADLHGARGRGGAQGLRGPDALLPALRARARACRPWAAGAAASSR